MKVQYSGNKAGSRLECECRTRCSAAVLMGGVTDAESCKEAREIMTYQLQHGPRHGEYVNPIANFNPYLAGKGIHHSILCFRLRQVLVAGVFRGTRIVIAPLLVVIAWHDQRLPLICLHLPSGPARPCFHDNYSSHASLHHLPLANPGMADQNIALVDRTDSEHSPEPTTGPATPSEAAHIDVLYENQRGWFIFGIPLFSSKALWNLRIDQSAWVDGRFKPSPVNITNAQVPDPSWVWEWKSWYVDMSHDVDEEGWQYSFWFRGAAWHGNHPWFHSFVRRRRWLRKRVKQKLPPKTKENRERLFGETFSIGTTLARTLASANPPSSEESKEPSLDEEVRDIPTLMRKLKKAAIDREKIVLINKFIEEGGEELFYLAERVCTRYHSHLTTD